jgi:DNA repair protein RadC
MIAQEYTIRTLRECQLPKALRVFTTPRQAAKYWVLHVETGSYFNPNCECLVALWLDKKRQIKGHQLIGIGTLDTCLISVREIFRGAIIAAASAVVLMHNHPSGDVVPSEEDIQQTHMLFKAGHLIGIDLLDHVIMGNPKYCSLRKWDRLRERGWIFGHARRDAGTRRPS